MSLLLIKTTKSKWIINTSLGLFLLSLTQAAYCVEGVCQRSWAGISLFLFGILGPFTSFAGLTWLANPALIISWISFYKNRKISFLSSAFACCFALLFLFCTQIREDEGGFLHTISGYRLGYWLWLTSSLTMLSGNIYLLSAKQPLNNSSGL
jgi:hypothetical protein